MSAVRKKQEDKNLKIFRELLTFENNKFCFDCNQRGPSYVNITIGSFVCTTCGGALRKYSHRVKSISMSIFSQTEMDFLKKRGNNICKKIYYGLSDSNCPPEVDIKNGMLDSHLRAKYEQKKWYLEPTQVLEEEALRQNQAIYDRVELPAPKLVKSYTVNSAANIIIEPPRQSSVAKVSLGKSNVANADGATVRLPMPANNKTSTKASNSDLKINSTEPSQFGDNFQFPAPISKSQTMNFSMPALVPVQQSSVDNNQSSTSQKTCASEVKGNDKYSALAELDDLFSTVTINKQPVAAAAAAPSSSPPSLPPGWDSTHPWSTIDHNYNHHQPNNITTQQTASLFNPFTQQPYLTSQQATASFNPFHPASQPAQAQAQSQPSYWPGPASSLAAANPFLTSSTANSSTNPFL